MAVLVDPGTGSDPTSGGSDLPFADRLWSALSSDAPRRGLRGLPVPGLRPPVPNASGFYAVTTLDVSGRLADRSPLVKLRWPPGLSVAVSVVHGAVVVVPDPAGKVRVTRQGHLRVPAAVRHTARLNSCDRVFVVAYPRRDLLLAYPVALLDAMVLAYHASYHPGGFR